MTVKEKMKLECDENKAFGINKEKNQVTDYKQKRETVEVQGCCGERCERQFSK